VLAFGRLQQPGALAGADQIEDIAAAVLAQDPGLGIGEQAGEARPAEAAAEAPRSSEDGHDLGPPVTVERRRLGTGADVAGVAALAARVLVAEVAEDEPAPAAGRVGVVDH